MESTREERIAATMAEWGTSEIVERAISDLGDGAVLKVFDGDDSWTASARDFLRDNADDEEVAAVVGALEVGESTAFGGGAAPLFVVERVA